MRHDRSDIAKSAAIAVCGCLLISSMVWTVLTEPRLNDAFWPRASGDYVAAALGGTYEVRVAGDRRIELGWISVVLRFGAGLILAATATGLWASRRSGEWAGTGVSSRFISGFMSTTTAIARPWMLAGIWLMGWFLGTSVSSPAPLNFLQLITPLAAALIGALSVNGFCNSTWGPSKLLRAPGNSAAGGPPGYSPLIILIVAAVCWEGMSFWMNERLYAGLLVPHGDSAMYEEHLWNVWHGKGFRSYLDQGLFLGEHIQVIHLLLLPLHYLWPSYLMLELVASCSLASCVIPIFLIARRHSGSSRAALWLGLAWLLFFPMHYLDIAIDLKTLRPSCYGLPFLFWGIDFAERRRLFSSSICFLIALTTQEDFALVVGSIGVVLFLLARKRTEAVSVVDARRFTVWSVSLVLFSVAWVLLAVLVVIPAFRGGDAVHYSRYFGELGSSPGDLVRSALRTPGKVLSQLFSLRTLFYVLVLTAPLGLSPLRKPVYLIGCGATFCMLSLIQLGNSVGATNVSGLSELPPIPYHHFHAPLLPVLFWAAAASLRSPGGVSAARFIFLTAAFTAFTSSLMPFGASFWSEASPFGRHRLYVPGERAAEFEKILATLPKDARIASTDYVHTRLTHFERSYDYSGYLRAVNNYQPGVPSDTDYIVIDTGHHYSEIRSIDQVRELQEEPDEWEVIPNDSDGLFIVLKRKRRAVAKPALRDGSDPETAQLQ
ncbi:MAG: DUF2079 domain-containing protein [Planctomycetaceae bacterium]